FYCVGAARPPLSFPTRRSSDLWSSWVGHAGLVPPFHRAKLRTLHDIGPPPGRPASFPLERLLTSGHPVRRPVHPDHLAGVRVPGDRKSTRLNSSHRTTSYAVFC